MWDRLQRVSEPGLPVTLDEAKSHIRVDLSVDDDRITSHIREAAQWIEGPNGCGYIMTEQTWKLRLDHFRGWINIPLAPVLSVDSIEYVDPDGATQTLDPSKYEVDIYSSPARIRPAQGLSWPSTDDVWNAITITFKAGHTDPGNDPGANVPADLKAAVKLIVGHLYEHSEQVVMGTIVSELPMGVHSIIERYRVGRFGY